MTKFSWRFNRRKLLYVTCICVLCVGALAVLLNRSQENGAVNNIPKEQSVNDETYLLHEGIITTVFWVGEDADESTNDGIHNSSSVWVDDWVASFGGIDDPSDRCGYKPCDFEPKENPFYFALPFSDYNTEGMKPASELRVVPWYTGKLEEEESIIKNRWIEIIFKNKSVFAQWEDAGPFGEDDADYVFGSSKPREKRAGLDVSPAVAQYLDFDGRDTMSWRFVEESEVPEGPWRDTITTSNPKW